MRGSRSFLAAIAWPRVWDAPLGVGMFFAISGYLITTLLLGEEASTGTFSLPRFYMRRAFRIPSRGPRLPLQFSAWWRFSYPRPRSPFARSLHPRFSARNYLRNPGQDCPLTSGACRSRSNSIWSGPRCCYLRHGASCSPPLRPGSSSRLSGFTQIFVSSGQEASTRRARISGSTSCSSGWLSPWRSGSRAASPGLRGRLLAAAGVFWAAVAGSGGGLLAQRACHRWGHGPIPSSSITCAADPSERSSLVQWAPQGRDHATAVLEAPPNPLPGPASRRPASTCGSSSFGGLPDGAGHLPFFVHVPIGFVAAFASGRP